MRFIAGHMAARNFERPGEEVEKDWFRREIVALDAGGLEMTQRPEELDKLIAEHQPGYALPRGFYTSQVIYDHDIATVWNRNWIWVGHQSQIPEPGDISCSTMGLNR